MNHRAAILFVLIAVLAIFKPLRNEPGMTLAGTTRRERRSASVERIEKPPVWGLS
jgi:hypothetical protein